MATDQHHVESPDLHERYFLATAERPIEARCPIDQTPLVSVIDRDHYAYECKGCGKNYQWGEKNPAQLREQATAYARSLAIKREAGDVLLKDLPKLERILALAREKKII